MTRLNPHELRSVAVEACVDDRTVLKYLREGSAAVRSTTRVSIELALGVLGWGYLVQPSQVELLDAWADGNMWGVLYRAALWSQDGGEPPRLDELRAAGAKRYAEVLETIARWRTGGVWAIVIWEQSANFGGGVFFSVEEYKDD